MKDTYFQISVPQDIAIGKYILSWDTINDEVPAIYTPIKDSTVIISSSSALTVEISDPLHLPYGGNTLLTPVNLIYSPDIEISVLLAFGERYEGISFSETKILHNLELVFKPGITEMFYTIYSDDSFQEKLTEYISGTISYEVVGVNKDVYKLLKPSAYF